MKPGNDPTRAEMLAALERFDHAAERFEVEAAIYWLACDYHGGQWSNLYAALCASPFRPSCLHHEVADEGDGAEYLYRHLRDEVL